MNTVVKSKVLCVPDNYGKQLTLLVTECLSVLNAKVRHLNAVEASMDAVKAGHKPAAYRVLSFER